MGKLWKLHNLYELNQETENVYRPVQQKIDSAIENLSTKKNPESGGLTAEFYQAFKELTPIL